ncbi:CoA pyrophosphatase [Methylocella sp.]|uniref:CoA pyrophosphatase n=1 Tax=Methylocella sp. TaxID=1978226 RepID=UPI0035AD9919
MTLRLDPDPRFAQERIFAELRRKLDRVAPPPDARDVVSDPFIEEEELKSFALQESARAAAVLIGLVAHEDGVGVLLTRRSATLRVHAGQIAFPGGRIEPEDAGPVGAALREAREEIGLDPSRVEPLGFLAPYVTGTGFRVAPVVARIVPPLELDLNPHEVESVFEAPFAFLMDAANHSIDTREFGGRLRRFHAMAYGEHYIWGATAGMLRNLYERLYL